MTPNFTVVLASTQGRLHQNLNNIPLAVLEIWVSKFPWKIPLFSSSSFHALCKYCYNLQTGTLIPLTFKASLSTSMTNVCTNFSENPIKSHTVIRCFMHKERWNLCHIYRVNCLLKQNEHCYVVSSSPNIGLYHTLAYLQVCRIYNVHSN